MRAAALAEATAALDSGSFLADLARRVAIPSESQNPARAGELRRYLEAEMRPSLERLGFSCEIFLNPQAGAGPILYAERIEDPTCPTCLTYGHGDVALGIDRQWRSGLNPWTITIEGDRLYGRGTADNKGQPQHQSRRDGGGAEDPRRARVQRQGLDRNGRGNRLARLA